jgi:MFS family permease
MATSADAAPRPRLPRVVLLLGWVSFLADVSSDMAYPVLPLFLSAVLGAPGAALGTIEGLAGLVVSLTAAWSGWRSDRTRRRLPFVRLGYGLPVLGKVLIAGATVWPHVLAGRALDRLGKGLRSSPRDALIAEAVGAEARGAAFGFHRAMDTAGAATGVGAAALLLALWGSATEVEALRAVLWVSAATALLSLGLTFVVAEPRPETPVSCTAAAAAADPLPRRYWTALAVLAVFAVANSSDAFLLLRARGQGFTPSQVVWGYALYNLTYAMFSYPVGRLSDRFGRLRLIGAGWVLYAAVYAGFAVAGTGGLWGLFALYGVYMALTEGVGKALVADCAPRGRRGTALGVFYLVLGLCTLIGNVLAGWLWDNVSQQAPFWVGSAAALLALVLLVAFRAPLSARPPR